MAFAGWLSFGASYGGPDSAETDWDPLVINNEYTRRLAEEFGCAYMLQEPHCPHLLDAVGPLDDGLVEETPWYDSRYPGESSRFFGAFGIDSTLVNDSTRQVPVLEGVSDGGVIGRTRHGMARLRQRAVLVAKGQDALDWGSSWLDRRLDPDGCEKAGGLPCGVGNVAFLADCPPPIPDVRKFTEWEVRAENLATNPSFEATSGTVEVRRNLALNPALRDDSNGWGDRIVTGVRTAESAGAFDWAWTATGDASTLDVNSRLNYSLTGLTIGETYTVSAWVRATNGGGWDFRGDQGGNGPTIPGAPGTPFPQDGEWHRVSVTFDAVGTEQWVGIRGGTSGLTGVYDVGITGLLWEASPTLGPYFDGSTQPAVRENLLNTPNGAFGASGEFAGRFGSDQSVETTDPPPGVSQYRRGVATQNNPVGWDFYANPQSLGSATTTFPVTAGETVTFSAWVRSNKTGNIRINYKVYDGMGAWIQDENVFVPLEVTDTWQEAVFHLPITETGYLASLFQNNGADVTGDYLDAVVCVERGVQTAGYFDGDTAPADGFAYGWRGDPNESTSFMYDADFSTAWEGAENASESVLTGVGVDDLLQGASGQLDPRDAYSTAYEPATGTSAARWTLGTAGAIGIPVSQVTPTEGVTYTMMFQVRPMSRDQVMRARIADNAGDYFTAPQGQWTQVTLSVPAGSGTPLQTGILLNSANGYYEAGDIIDIDSVLIVEGEYGGPYFDGNTPSFDDLNYYEWTDEEEENASTSIWYGRQEYFEPMDLIDYRRDIVDPLRRYLLNAATVSGPFVISEAERDGIWIREVEWTLESELPFVVDRPLTLATREDSFTPTTVQDVAINLVPNPSLEEASGSVVVATNYSTNPSVEVNATGWSAEVTGGITPAPTGARSTEVSASGGASYKSSVVTTNSGTNGRLQIIQDVALPAYVSGQTFSATVWGFATVASGSAVLDGVHARLQWRTASASVLTDGIESGPISGGPLSKAALVRPPSATVARIIVDTVVTSWSSGATIDLYADALAVTVP